MTELEPGATDVEFGREYESDEVDGYIEYNPDDLTQDEIERLEYKSNVIDLLQAFYDQTRVDDEEVKRQAAHNLIKIAVDSELITEEIDEERERELLNQIEMWTSDELATTRYQYPQSEENISPDQAVAFDQWAQSLEAYYFALILNYKISVDDAQKAARYKFLEYIASVLGHDIQDDDGVVIETSADTSAQPPDEPAETAEPLSHSSDLSGSGKPASLVPGSGKQAPTTPGSGKATVSRPGHGKGPMPMMRAKKPSSALKTHTGNKKPEAIGTR